MPVAKTAEFIVPQLPTGGRIQREQLAAGVGENHALVEYYINEGALLQAGLPKVLACSTIDGDDPSLDPHVDHIIA